jgi:signal peptidase I
MEVLTNPSWQYVVSAVVVLVILRLIFGRGKSSLAKQISEISESLAIAIFLVFLVIRPFAVQAYYIPSGSMRPTLLEQDRILVNKFIFRFREPKHGDIVVFKSPPRAQQDEKDFIKRVMGVPGDRIRVTPGYVLVDDIEWDHNELRAKLLDFSNASLLDDVRVKLAPNAAYVDGKEVTRQDIAMAAGHPNAHVTIHPGAVYRNGRKLSEDYTAEDPDQPYPISEEDTFTVPRGRIFVMGDNRNHSSDSRVWGLLDRNRVEGEAMFIFWPFNRIRWLR